MPAVMVELRPVPRWSKNKTYVKELVTTFCLMYTIRFHNPSENTYLIPLVKDRSDPAILLGGPAAHPRASLQIDQPGKLFFFLGGFDWRHQTMHTPGEQSESAFIGFTVVDWNVEEQLCHAEFACVACQRYWFLPRRGMLFKPCIPLRDAYRGHCETFYQSTLQPL